MIDTVSESAPSAPSRMQGWKLFLIIFFAVVLALLAGAWLIKAYIFPSMFSPVELSQKEEMALDYKLRQLNYNPSDTENMDGADNKTLEPKAYAEKNTTREISFSEKEINALLARNTDLAEKMAIDLSGNLASARLVFPVDPDFPILGGKTIRANAGVAISYREGKPSIILKGLSVWGVSLPNAWLGNLKNVDIVKEFGGGAGFWKSFAEGVEYIEVKEGQLYIKLAQ